MDVVEGGEWREVVEIEAREVSMGVGMEHTFVRIKIGEEVYLWDGVGYGRWKPFFGLEEEAPEHLKGSQPDMINEYRRMEKLDKTI